MNMHIAKTILHQIGGNRFILMTGARSMTGTERGLNIKLPSNFARHGINYVQIELTGNDDYTVKFSKVHDMKINEIAALDGVYSDQLQDIFTAATGLAVRL